MALSWRGREKLVSVPHEGSERRTNYARLAGADCTEREARLLELLQPRGRPQERVEFVGPNGEQYDVPAYREVSFRKLPGFRVVRRYTKQPLPELSPDQERRLRREVEMYAAPVASLRPETSLADERRAEERRKEQERAVGVAMPLSMPLSSSPPGKGG